MEQNYFKFDKRIENAAETALNLCSKDFLQTDNIAQYNSMKVLSAFTQNKVSESHFAGSTGYGYDDRGREVLDSVFASAFGAEAALVRHNFVSGTHAITTALFGVLRTGDIMLACTGKPYDTLDEVIGLRSEGMGSLKDYGVIYKQIDLKDGEPDIEAIKSALSEQIKNGAPVKMAYIQRSRGYSLRPSLTIAKIREITSAVKSVSPETAVVVDNCYGEFVEREEPIQAGADLIIGSLIKNAGGGIAETGGYIAGRRDLVELASYRLTSPGAGAEVGATLGQSRNMFRGFFFAPHVTAQAVKTAIFASALFEILGFKATPRYTEPRTDIVETIELKNPHALIAFCRGIQSGSPVDSFVSPEPWDMPGYDSKVIMAAGAFTLGASIELSADAPLRKPYAVWMQGGLTFETGMTGVMCAAQALADGGFLY
ncbi:MAG TPA: methionine gamma-lyase family protein [Ruminiclostridium sp.]|nr:methionine gamma-lyase family protein [Ruminiclostridium sp.]